MAFLDVVEQAHTRCVESAIGGSILGFLFASAEEDEAVEAQVSGCL